MRSEGAGKGDALRYGVNWKRYGENFDVIFRKKDRIDRVIAADFKKAYKTTFNRAYRKFVGKSL